MTQGAAKQHIDLAQKAFNPHRRAPPGGAPRLSYASALLSPTAEADADAALAEAAAVAAVSCRLSLMPRRHARPSAAAAGGAAVVHGRVMLAPRQSRRLRAGAGGSRRGAAALQRVEEEVGEEGQGDEWCHDEW